MKLQKSKEISEARGMYNVAVMKYVGLFEAKYDLEFLRWAGGLAMFSDFEGESKSISFDLIKHDIDYYPIKISLEDE